MPIKIKDMKKKIIILALLALSTSLLAVERHRIVKGTNSVSIDGVKYPLNTIIMKINRDSVFVSFYTVPSYQMGYNPIVKPDSFRSYTNNGTAFTSVSQMDSFYQVAFVK